MSKPFITYTAQVEKLKNEKNLVITDDDFAVESLQNISYYALIGGYKHPFIDIHTRKYINEACFEDIVALYEFDEELRALALMKGQKPKEVIKDTVRHTVNIVKYRMVYNGL